MIKLRGFLIVSLLILLGLVIWPYLNRSDQQPLTSFNPMAQVDRVLPSTEMPAENADKQTSLGETPIEPPAKVADKSKGPWPGLTETFALILERFGIQPKSNQLVVEQTVVKTGAKPAIEKDLYEWMHRYKLKQPGEAVSVKTKLPGMLTKLQQLVQTQILGQEVVERNLDGLRSGPQTSPADYPTNNKSGRTGKGGGEPSPMDMWESLKKQADSLRENSESFRQLQIQESATELKDKDLVWLEKEGQTLEKAKLLDVIDYLNEIDEPAKSNKTEEPNQPEVKRLKSWFNEAAGDSVMDQLILRNPKLKNPAAAKKSSMNAPILKRFKGAKFFQAKETASPKMENDSNLVNRLVIITAVLIVCILLSSLVYVWFSS